MLEYFWFFNLFAMDKIMIVIYGKKLLFLAKIK